MITSEKKLTGTVSLFSDSRFNIEDFKSRWTSARVAALKSVLGCQHPCSDENLDFDLDEENLLLMRVKAEKKELILRAVFDFSRKLGVGFSRYFGISLEIQDLAEILPLSGSPCYLGKWERHKEAYVSLRPGCADERLLGSFGCDFWREALDGFIMGASDEARLARHRSLGHGDGDCADILFEDSGMGPQQGQHRGVIPESFAQGLEVIARNFSEKQITVKWDGYSEGVLYYRLEAAGAKSLCGAGGGLMHGVLKAEVQKFFPEIKVRDSAPLAVIGDAN
ncbi:MAG: hypothetical protein IPJ71_12095 [Bdellovibrionales bacterium]|nr:hypothetical protein [Bdellovibrionales bacterium]